MIKRALFALLCAWVTACGVVEPTDESEADVTVGPPSFVAAWTGTYTVVVYDASSGHAFTGDYEIVLLNDRT